MPQTITIRDEDLAAGAAREFSLEGLSEDLTVRELIRSRVYQEVKDYNSQQGQPFNGLIQPTDSERTLNGYEFKTERRIDWKEQLEKALAGFAQNQILVLIDDRQVESLDETVHLSPETVVTFLRLTLLVGG